ncbi:MAG: hypothetical protein LBE30_01635 [Comamonas sp.]|jgi:hypothetical protein|nr:hypothetical protein [Comamonas sp.]
MDLFHKLMNFIHLNTWACLPRRRAAGRKKDSLTAVACVPNLTAYSGRTDRLRRLWLTGLLGVTDRVLPVPVIR